MVAGTVTTEVVSTVEAKRLWKAMVKDGHNLLPKVLPDLISTISLQGDGGVGSIRQINFTPANKDFNYSKERLDEIDDDKFEMKYTAIEGGLLGKKLNAAKFELKLNPTKEGGCVSTWTCHFDTISGSADEAKLQEMKEASIGTFKKLEGYLLSNPTLYCA
eukprot:Gb_21895 [translate_table: standard]